MVNNNPYAVIAGGSKGIGFAIAEAIAKRNYNLVLIARTALHLAEAKSYLETKYSITVQTVEIDLSNNDAADILAAWLSEKKIQVKILCNNAGIGGSKDFLNATLHEMQYMIRLNLFPAIAVSEKLIAHLEKNQPAFIMNTASIAGFSPIPSKNMYAATNSAIIFFSYALRKQLKDKNIYVSCLCPGPVFTKPEILKTTIDVLGRFGKAMAVEPGKVGEIAVRGMLKKKKLIIPGLLAKVTAMILRTLPDNLLAYLMQKFRKRGT